MESQQFFLLLWVQPFLTPPMFTWEKSRTDCPSPFLFTKFKSRFLCYATHCKLFIALSANFCPWPSFLVSRELLHQCLCFSCILIWKKGIENFVYMGFVSDFYVYCLVQDLDYITWGKKKVIFWLWNEY